MKVLAKGGLMSPAAYAMYTKRGKMFADAALPDNCISKLWLVIARVGQMMVNVNYY